MGKPGARATRWAVSLTVFFSVFAAATAVLAITGGLRLDRNAQEAVDTADGEPYRTVESALTGDLWILDRVIGANSRWEVASVDFVATGVQSASAVVDKNKGSLVETNSVATLRLRIASDGPRDCYRARNAAVGA